MPLLTEWGRVATDPMTQVREVLGPGAWVPPPKSCSLGGAAAVAARLSVPWEGPWGMRLDVETLPPVTKLALGMVGRGGADRDATYVFVDGSGPGEGFGAAAWAIAVVTRGGDGIFHFLGSLAGSLVLDPGDPGWIGAERATNNQAEAAAVAVALAWAMQDRDGSPCEIWADSEFALGLGSGAAGAAGESALEQLLRPLAQCVQQRRSLTFRHVAAHVGHPWNELVDTLSRGARGGPSAHERLGVLRDLASDPLARKWLWLPAAAREVQVQYPVVLGGGLMVAQHVIPRGVREIFAVEGDDGLCPAPLHVKFGFINVLSLGPSGRDGEGLRVAGAAPPAGRPIALARQFHESGYLFVGMAETRRRQPGLRGDGEFLSLAAAADADGNYGCELWVNRVAEYGEDRGVPLKITARHLAVVHSEPTLLLVAVRAPKLAVDIMVGHAPGAHRPRPELDAWWKRAARVADGRGAAAPPMVFLVDANARLGSVVSRAVGPVGAEPQTAAGGLLHDFLLRESLYLPTTFVGPGRQETFVGARGDRKRIDYIALPEGWEPYVISAEVDHDVDVSMVRDDHFLVAVVTELPAGGPEDWHERRPVRFDRAKMRDPEAVARFRSEVAGIAGEPWETDVHSHAARLAAGLADAAERSFPLGRGTRKPPKKQMSDLTWDIVRAKRKALQVSRAAMVEAERLEAHARRGAGGLPEGPPRAALLGRAAGLRRTAERAARLRPELHRLTRQSAVGDCRAACRRCYEEVAEAAAEQGRGRLFDLVRAAKRATPKDALPLRRLKLEDGSFAPDPHSIRRRWQRHFAEVEAAEVMPLEELADREVTRQNVAGVRPPEDVAEVPTLACTEGLIRRAPHGKAAGEDGLPAELLALDAPSVAQLLHPLYLKVALRCQEPLQFKGGTLMELYKKRGPLDEAGSHRGILLSDAMAKHMHRFYRAPASQVLARKARDTQCGGIGKKGTDFAHHILQEFADVARSRGVAMVGVFVDVVSAFYTVLRQLAFRVDCSDEAVASLLRTLGLPPASMDRLRRRLEERPSLEAAGVSQHVVGIIAEGLTGTWFGTEGLREVAATGRGTRPGDPFGDLVFNFVAEEIFTGVCDRMEADGMVQFFEWDGSRSPLPTGPAAGRVAVGDVSYVDDGLFLAMVPSAEAVPAAAAIARMAADEFESRGLRLDFRAGKSAAEVIFAGPGARKARTELWCRGQPSTTFEGTAGPVVPTFTRQYVHLGSVAADRPSLLPEIARRRSLMSASIRPVRKKLIANRGIPSPHRGALADVYMLSALIYNAQVFRQHLASEAAAFHKAAMWGYRMAADVFDLPADKRPSDLAVLAKTERQRPEDLLAARRCAYFARVRASAPKALVALLQAGGDREGSWLQATVAALEWMRLRVAHLAALPPPARDLAPWVRLAVDHPGPWRAYVRKAVEAAKRAVQADARRERWEGAFLEALAGGGLELAGHRAQQSEQGDYHCYECGKAFPSRKALVLHAYREHSRKAAARSFIAGPVCPCCMTCFVTRARCVGHVAYHSPRCLAAIQNSLEPMPEDEVRRLDEEDRALQAVLRRKGTSVHTADQPCYQVLGPRQDVRLPEGWDRPQPQARQQAGPPPPAQADAGEVGEPVDVRVGGHAAVREVCFLQPRALVVLHLFSGHRREGDLQAQLEDLTAAWETPVHVLSLDVAVHATLGDLRGYDNVAKWAAAIRGGRVHAMVAGPPCETWSLARELPDGPPPLRSRSEPWGRLAVTERQWLQLQTGNELLWSTLWLFAELLRAGGAAIVEHPEPWRRPGSSVCIWMLRWVRALLAAPAVETVSFDQCEHGQFARKPTRLLALRLPSLGERMRATPGRGRCSHRGHAPLGGRDEQGRFRTAPAKVYPQAMCRALAGALADTLAPFARGGSRGAGPGEWAPLRAQLEGTGASGASWRPDFAG